MADMHDHAVDILRARRAEIDTLVSEMRLAGHDETLLDDAVHDTAAAWATSVNNAGLDYQVAVLLDGLTVEQFRQHYLAG